MSRLPLLDLEALRQTRLGPALERSLREGSPDPAYFALMGHNVDMAEAINSLARTVYGKGRLSPQLKEVIRVKLSVAAECNY